MISTTSCTADYETRPRSEMGLFRAPRRKTVVRVRRRRGHGPPRPSRLPLTPRRVPARRRSTPSRTARTPSAAVEATGIRQLKTWRDDGAQIARRRRRCRRGGAGRDVVDAARRPRLITMWKRRCGAGHRYRYWVIRNRKSPPNY